MAPRASVPFGLWPSSISAEALTRGARAFGHRQGDGDAIYWSESRPAEKGRQVIVRARPGEAPEDVLPAPFSARSKVHEYGGAEFMVADGTIYFVNADDLDVWCLEHGKSPERLTREPKLRFADLVLDRHRRRLIAVAERHTSEPPENLLVEIGLDGRRRGKVGDLVTGRDFYAFPVLSPDGTRLAYLGWDLPDMPWDQAALYLADVDAEGKVARRRTLVAGGNGVACMQPVWLDDARLLFISDASGFGNLMLWSGGEVRALTRLEAELGLPMWNLGPRTYLVAGPDRVIATASVDGKPSFVTVTGLDKRRPDVEIAPVAAASLGSLAISASGIATVIGRSKAPAGFVMFQSPKKAPTILRAASDLALDPRSVSVGETVSFRGGDRKTTFAQLYRPVSAGCKAPKGTLPPALVLAHGGPTSQAGRGLALRVQYYTSRGFTVLDVDYSGSTGYGRGYRERLDGRWGIADVADCAAAARFLVAEGLADPTRIAIAGGSAGGYTVLMALATTKAFAAGSSHYGISDLTLLMQHTHKFEAGYLHRLLGTTPKSWKAVCKARSPLTLIDAMTTPLVLFQGLDDRVVPPEQSRLIHERLKARGIATELYEFAGEGHGFRQAATIEAVAKAELAFLLRALAIA